MFKYNLTASGKACNIVISAHLLLRFYRIQYLWLCNKMQYLQTKFKLIKKKYILKVSEFGFDRKICFTIEDVFTLIFGLFFFFLRE